MALISCKECGKEMSENAKVCPNCGNPNTLTEKEKKEEVKKKEKIEQQAGVFAIITTIVVLIAGYFIIIGLWKGLKGNELMDAMGINATNDTLTIKSKDKNKIDNWKNDAMNWLGFEYVEE